MKYLPRTIEPVIKKASEQFKVVMVSGMRQVGKSTLLKHLADEHRKLVTVTTSTASQIAADPALFFEQNPAPAIIDEIQLAPSLFGELKAVVDRSEKKGQYWVSGSEKLQLMARVSEALPGRLLPFDLLPLSVYEQEGKGLEQKPFVPSKDVYLSRPLAARSVEQTWKTIFKGGWPELHAGKVTPRWLFSALVDLYIQRDVRVISNVDKTLSFDRFLRALAFCSGQELNVTSLAAFAGVGTPTVNRWLSIAAATGLIWLLPAFSLNVKKQIAKKPKLYMVDTGLLAYLLDLKTPKEMAAHQNAGRFFETFVVMEIVKSWLHNGHRPELYYLREDKGAEIDLIMRDDVGKYHCIEVKTSTHPDTHMTKWIRKFEDYGYPMGLSSIISMTNRAYPLSKTIAAQSIWDI